MVMRDIYSDLCTLESQIVAVEAVCAVGELPHDHEFGYIRNNLRYILSKVRDKLEPVTKRVAFKGKKAVAC